MDTDIIIYAVVAIGLILWLRSILGTRNGNERSRPNPFATPPPVDGKPALPGGAKPAPGQPALLTDDRPLGLERHMAITGAGANDALSAIARADKSFDLARFMHGAQDAFVMIVEAFAAGDRATLRDLLSDPVYAAFTGALDARGVATASVEIHAVRRVDVIAAKLDGKQASVTIRFTSDQTNILRDAAGTVTQGNPDRVNEVIDVWTFTRDIRSKEPNWLVADTREEEAPPTAGLPVSA